MARPAGAGRVRAVVALHQEHDRFLRDLIEVVRRRTGVELTRSDVLRILVETAMGLKLSEADIDEAYTKVCGVETLRQTRDAVRSEIKHTEMEIQVTLRDSPEDGESLRVFRRNLAYQMRRLAAVEVQIAQWEQAKDGDGNGAAQIIGALVLERLFPE